MPILDLSDIPQAEDDRFEFESSQTTPDKLRGKIEKAASAFCNTGGGCFLAGLGNDGNADGGFPQQFGRQSIRDWVDQVLHRVEPHPHYTVRLIDDVNGRGTLNQDHVVLAIEFPESFYGPHMASDHVYYIRAGAHSVPARNFIVESIRAKRCISYPQIRHIVNINPYTSATSAISIDLVSLSDAPLLDVRVVVAPLEEYPYGSRPQFPLKVPLIDRLHDFVFHFDVPGQSFNTKLVVEYSDIMGKRYLYETELSEADCVKPWNLGRYRSHENPIHDVLRDINRTIERLSK